MIKRSSIALFIFYTNYQSTPITDANSSENITPVVDVVVIQILAHSQQLTITSPAVILLVKLILLLSVFLVLALEDFPQQ